MHPGTTRGDLRHARVPGDFLCSSFVSHRWSSAYRTGSSIRVQQRMVRRQRRLYSAGVGRRAELSTSLSGTYKLIKLDDTGKHQNDARSPWRGEATSWAGIVAAAAEQCLHPVACSPNGFGDDAIHVGHPGRAVLLRREHGPDAEDQADPAPDTESRARSMTNWQDTLFPGRRQRLRSCATPGPTVDPASGLNQDDGLPSGV